MNENDPKTTTPPNAEWVAEFLRQNPEFFNQHPELLTQLRIPHPSGDAVSLVERQMSLLREQNERNRQKLDELVDIARANEELARRMHMLALTLMDAEAPLEIFETLYKNLRKNFNADLVEVRLFAEPSMTVPETIDEFRGRDADGRILFAEVIQAGKPVCGPLNAEQHAYLFGDEGAAIQSWVLVPLQGDDWNGLMAIGSFDAWRFHPGMGVDLLSNLGEILSLILKPWVASRE